MYIITVIRIVSFADWNNKVLDLPFNKLFDF